MNAPFEWVFFVALGYKQIKNLGPLLDLSFTPMVYEVLWHVSGNVSAQFFNKKIRRFQFLKY